MAPHRRCRRLQTPPRLGSPFPPGRCVRFSEDEGPPQALQEAPNTPWAGLPVPPRPVRPVLRRRWPPIDLAGGSEHPLGWAPRPPQAGAPGSPNTMAPLRPYRRLGTPPGLGSPSPQAGAPGSPTTMGCPTVRGCIVRYPNVTPPYYGALFVGHGVSLPTPPQFGCDECILTRVTSYQNRKGGKRWAKQLGSSWYVTPLLWDTSNGPPRPYRRLQTPPGLGSPSPRGRCARFSENDGPP